MNINKIATMATRLKKPNRAEAFNVVRAMAENMGEDKETDKKNLSLLYSFFLPVVTKPKTPEQWVAKAMNKKDPRFYLNYCYSDGKRYMASDGHRLHWIPTDKPEGYYDAAGNAVEFDMRYPNIDRIIPKGRADKSINNDIKSVENGVYGLADNICDETYVNHKYLQEVLSFGGDVKIFNADRLSAVRFDFGDGRHALIMPVRIQ